MAGVTMDTPMKLSLENLRLVESRLVEDLSLFRSLLSEESKKVHCYSEVCSAMTRYSLLWFAIWKQSTNYLLLYLSLSIFCWTLPKRSVDLLHIRSDTNHSRQI